MYLCHRPGDAHYGGVAPQILGGYADPKLVAVGECAQTCGVFKGSYAVAGSVDSIIPGDVFVPGCPPEPADVLRGIRFRATRMPQK